MEDARCASHHSKNSQRPLQTLPSLPRAKTSHRRHIVAVSTCTFFCGKTAVHGMEPLGDHRSNQKNVYRDQFFGQHSKISEHFLGLEGSEQQPTLSGGVIQLPKMRRLVTTKPAMPTPTTTVDAHSFHKQSSQTTQNKAGTVQQRKNCAPSAVCQRNCGPLPPSAIQAMDGVVVPPEIHVRIV